MLLFLFVIFITPLEVVLHFFLFREDESSFNDVFTLRNNSIFFLGSFFIAFSSSIYKIMSDWMNQQRERIDLQRQTLRSELKYLKTQINPHFFFNTLNSLYALTLKKSDKAPEIVLKLSDMMRYMLYESNERSIDLSQELNYVKNYLELERVRHGDNFRIDLEITGDPQGHKIAPLLFIPFLENSFKHGLDHELRSGFVKIIIHIDSDSLELMVENSKPKQISLPPAAKKVGGIGLSNVRRRLNILYPGRYALNVNDQDEIFQIDLRLNGTKTRTI
jgi:LytS/YehU family sensor histidine kinase